MLLLVNRVNIALNLKNLTFTGKLVAPNKYFGKVIQFNKPECSSQRINLVLYMQFSTAKKIFFASAQREEKKTESAFSSLVHKTQGPDEVSTHFSGTRKVKQAATDLSYIAIIGFGALILGTIGYFLFSELFSRETPSGIYDESSKLCLENIQVKDALGHPIKVTAESGGRRVFHVKHKYFLEDGQLCLTLNYYLEGPKNKGTVICKLRKNESSNKLEYDHIVVKLDYPHRGENRIIVKTNEVTGF